MKFLIIGLGSIGKRHIRNLISLKINPRNITGYDPRKDRVEEVRAYGIKNFISNLNTLKTINLMGLLFAHQLRCM